MDDLVLFSVDPHKASATIAVLDPATRTLIEGAGTLSRPDVSGLIREGDVDGVRAAVVGNAHGSIVADLPIVSCR